MTVSKTPLDQKCRSQPLLIVNPSNTEEMNGSVDVFDAMVAASPPRSSLGSFGADLYGENAMAAQYRAWKSKHPSALDSFHKLINAGEGKEVVLFLDYDGTLSPIVEDPDIAYMTEGMREAVKEVATFFPTAVISGRGREKVYDFVQLAELYYAGSHGMDIMGPPTVRNGSLRRAELHKRNGTRTVNGHWLSGEENGHVHRADRAIDGQALDAENRVYFQPANKYVPLINEVSKRIADQVGSMAGVCIENNKFCLSVHFRRVCQEKWEDLAQIVKDIVKEYSSSLHLTYGRKVLEVRPNLAWNKGKAVAYLLNALGLESGIFPVYIGDDRTDEDAFHVLKERGDGCGIVVSTVAKATHATYSLRDPLEVRDFLHRLVEWKKGFLPRQKDDASCLTHSNRAMFSNYEGYGCSIHDYE